MGNVQYTIANGDRSDNSAFTVPGDEDGGAGDDSVELDYHGTDDAVDSYVHVENGWDVNVDVTVRGSHYLDSTMASAADDGSSVAVSSGGSTDFFDVTSGHAYLELNVNPAGTPTSGDLTVTFQSREA